MARREIPRELEMAAESWGEEFALQVAKALLSRPRSKLLDAIARLPTRWAKRIVTLARALVGSCALCLYKLSVLLRDGILIGAVTVGVVLAIGLPCLLVFFAWEMNETGSRQVPRNSLGVDASTESTRVDPTPPTPWPWERATQSGQ
jgi:hypothetical protein